MSKLQLYYIINICQINQVLPGLRRWRQQVELPCYETQRQVEIEDLVKRYHALINWFLEPLADCGPKGKDQKNPIFARLACATYLEESLRVCRETGNQARKERTSKDPLVTTSSYIYLQKYRLLGTLRFSLLENTMMMHQDYLETHEGMDLKIKGR